MSFTYKGLKDKLERHIVTDEEIDRQMQRLREQSPRIAVITNRPTQRGDEVVLDYAGYCDGEQFAGGTAEKQTLVLGSGTFIPGFEEQLLDKVPGEKVTVKVTFPTQYHAENLAGKEAEFRCVIHEIREKSTYELDDTFAKEVGQCDTFAEMRQRLAESLQAYSDERGQMDLQDRLLRTAASTLELEVTPERLAEAVEAQMQALQAQLAQQGLSMEMYCQFMNTTEEQLRQDAEPEAEAAVRMRAAIEKIVELEHLVAEPQEIADAYAIVCRRNGITMEQLQQNMDAQLEEAILNSVLAGKVMRLILDAADLTVV